VPQIMTSGMLLIVFISQVIHCFNNLTYLKYIKVSFYYLNLSSNTLFKKILPSGMSIYYDTLFR
jgi:hypothetical protein